MRIGILSVLALVLFAGSAEAQLTLQDAQNEADAWVAAREGVIRDRVRACLQTANQEGREPTECHTAWAAGAFCNNTSALSSLCDLTLDDPGQPRSTVCGNCFDGQQTFAQAGINIPATAPVNAKINISKAPGGARGEQFVYRIQYDGQIWEKGMGDQTYGSFDWRQVESTP